MTKSAELLVVFVLGTVAPRTEIQIMLPHSFFSVRMFTGHYDHAELLHTRSYNSNFELRRQLDPTIHDPRFSLFAAADDHGTPSLSRRRLLRISAPASPFFALLAATIKDRSEI